MKLIFVFLLAFITGCSSQNNFSEKIIGAWEVYSLNDKTDLYKAFVGTTMTFNSDGSFFRGKDSKKYMKGTYKIKNNVLNIIWDKKAHSSIINIKGLELSFEKDPSFTHGDIPMKSIYRKK